MIAADIESRIVSKLNRRILWFLMLCYFVAILDRANISVASLTMNDALGFSPAVYGFGASIFFIGYFLFEVPSNVILGKVGAPLWIGRIMVTWGIVTICMLLVHNKTTFYIARFMLGVAEAGFYPGIIFYLSYFYPQRHRTKAIGLFQVASPMSLMIGTPLIGLLFNMHGVFGLHGWQHIFLFTGIPAIVLGVICFFYLKPGIRQTHWLSNEEKDWLTNEIKTETAAKPKTKIKLFQVFAEPQVWLATFILFAINVGFNAVAFWVPQIIKSVGHQSDLMTTTLSGIPYFVAAVAVILVSRHSDKTGERKLHVLFCLVGSALGFYLASIQAPPAVTLFGLSIATGGLLAAMPPLWTYPIAMFTGVAAAAAIATINSVGVLGGIVGPNVIGLIADKTGNPAAALVFVAVFMLGGAGVALFLKVPERKENIKA